MKIAPEDGDSSVVAALDDDDIEESLDEELGEGNNGEDDEEFEDSGVDEQKHEIHRQGFKKKKPVAIELFKNTKEKEIQFLVGSIQDKMKDIFEAEKWQQRKTLIILIAVVTVSIATFMIMYGLALSVLFAGNKVNIPMAVVGFFLYLPFCFGCCYLGLPSKNEREKRRQIKALQKERQSDSFLDNMMLEAAKRAKPPEKKVRLIAIVRGSRGFPRQEVVFIGTTVRAMLQDIERATGLPQIQQIIKLENGAEITKNLDAHFVNDLKFRRDTKLYVYNKGRYEMAMFELHNPVEAAKMKLAPPPPTWEESMKKHWAKGSALDDAISKNNKKSFLDLDSPEKESAPEAVNLTKMQKDVNKKAKQLGDGDSVIGSASLGGSLTGNMGSIAAGSATTGKRSIKDEQSIGSLSTKKKAWS